MPVVCTYCLEESRRLLADAGAATRDVTWCLFGRAIQQHSGTAAVVAEH